MQTVLGPDRQMMPEVEGAVFPSMGHCVALVL